MTDFAQTLTSLLLLIHAVLAAEQPPNIILIVADDYGYNDIGYHGSELKTPTLDKLAAEGVKLENYYVQPICTPSRSQLLSDQRMTLLPAQELSCLELSKATGNRLLIVQGMTTPEQAEGSFVDLTQMHLASHLYRVIGRYQIHTGLQHGVIKPCVPTALPLEDKMLADKLKEVGYSTHAVGKWHLGFYKKEFTPMERGFDSFFGYLLGEESYYQHFRRSNSFGGIDFHKGLKPYNGSYGEYSTTVFIRRAQSIIENHNSSQPLFLYLPYQSVHAPLQVPDHYKKEFHYIKHEARKTYAAMVAAMDEGIGNLTDTLKSTSIYDNTLIVFTTDNGGQVFAGGNNAPFRGNKASYFEGGIRGVGFVSGAVIKNKGTVSHHLMHVSDWFPTLINLAGASLNGTQPDGFDMWQSITNNKTSPRNEIIYNIDPMNKCKSSSVSDVFDTSVQAALRYGDYKILTGNPGYDKWVPEPTSPNYNSSELEIPPDDLNAECKQAVYLFNIAKDPEERHDLSQSEPELVDLLLKRLAMWNSTAVPVNYPPADTRCNPALHGGFWMPWR